jgi:hypothetical protein
MKKMQKTDECIEMLLAVERIFEPLYYNNKNFLNKEFIIELQENAKAILKYKLMPHIILDKATARKTITDISNFDAFWDAYQLVTFGITVFTS